MVVIFHSKSRKFNLHKQDIQDIANTGKPEVLFLFEYFCDKKTLSRRYIKILNTLTQKMISILMALLQTKQTLHIALVS